MDEFKAETLNSKMHEIAQKMGPDPHLSENRVYNHVESGLVGHLLVRQREKNR
jgi:hypothetical protein